MLLSSWIWGGAAGALAGAYAAGAAPAVSHPPPVATAVIVTTAELDALAGSTESVTLDTAPRAGAPAATAGSWFATPDSVVYESSGVLNFALGKKFRDRTITLSPRCGPTGWGLAVRIVDHEEDDRIVSGLLEWQAPGAFHAADTALVNTGNILMVTPAVVAALRSNRGPVHATGQAEVAGEVIPVGFVHELVGSPGAAALKVRTRVESPDHQFQMETMSLIGRDGWPLLCRSRGILRSHWDCNVDLTLVRIAAQQRDHR